MPEAKILLITEEKILEESIRNILEPWEFKVEVRPEVSEALQAFKDNSFDIVIIKVGFLDQKILSQIRILREKDTYASLVVISEVSSLEFIQELFKRGIYDCLKPQFEPKDLFIVIKRALVFKALRKNILNLESKLHRLQQQNEILEKRIAQSTKNVTTLYKNLHETYLKIIKTLAQAIDARDHYTHSHSRNVTRYAVAIAEEMGVDFKEIEEIREACELHDLGKLGISDYILTKSTSLSPEEWKEIKLHSIKGAEILKPLEHLKRVVSLIRSHHERYDGKGYPDGLKKDKIPLGARILSLADSYDAMISARAYRKKPLTKKEAIEEIKRNSGKQFDPKVVEAFLKIIERI